ETADTENRDLKHEDRTDHQKTLRHMLDRRYREDGAGDGPKRGSGGDEAEQALALFRREDVDDHLPEDGDSEQIEDRRPDKEDASDPDGLFRRRQIQRQSEQQDVGAEKAIRNGNEFLAGKCL